MPRVCVVLPVYNCVKYLRKALDSVLNQSFKDFEIVIVDDGSNDGTEEIIELLYRMFNPGDQEKPIKLNS